MGCARHRRASSGKLVRARGVATGARACGLRARRRVARAGLLGRAPSAGHAIAWRWLSRMAAVDARAELGEPRAHVAGGGGSRVGRAPPDRGGARARARCSRGVFVGALFARAVWARDDVAPSDAAERSGLGSGSRRGRGRWRMRASTGAGNATRCHRRCDRWCRWFARSSSSGARSGARSRTGSAVQRPRGILRGASSGDVAMSWRSRASGRSPPVKRMSETNRCFRNRPGSGGKDWQVIVGTDRWKLAFSNEPHQLLVGNPAAEHLHQHLAVDVVEKDTMSASTM